MLYPDDLGHRSVTISYYSFIQLVPQEPDESSQRVTVVRDRDLNGRHPLEVTRHLNTMKVYVVCAGHTSGGCCTLNGWRAKAFFHTAWSSTPGGGRSSSPNDGGRANGERSPPSPSSPSPRPTPPLPLRRPAAAQQRWRPTWRTATAPHL